MSRLLLEACLVYYRSLRAAQFNIRLGSVFIECILQSPEEMKFQGERFEPYG
jgi:hypothetical protein